MTNLNGFLVKTISLCSFFLALSLIVSPVFATSIAPTSQLEYKIEDNGDLTGVVRVTLDSQSTIPEVLNYYTLVLPFPQMEVTKVSSAATDYTFTEHEQTNGTDLVINFGEEYVSNTSYFVFDIYFNSKAYFDDDEIAGRNVSVPTAIPNHTISKITLITPQFWGTVNWSSEKDYTESANILTIPNPTKERLSVIWGDVVSYDFEITKTYTNYDSSDVLYDLFVPGSDTNQQVLFSDISPSPTFTSVDDNGNIQFSFFVETGKEVDIKIDGEVLMRKTPSRYTHSELKDLTESMKYWELTDDDLITEIKIYLKGKGIADSVTSITSLMEKTDRDSLYRSIYTYITDSLELTDALDSQVIISPRKGATDTLSNGEDGASVEDYADSMVAILRSYDVPAVVVSGFIPAVSGYKSEGFFHTWVEYWNQDEAKWLILDPALEDLVENNLYYEDHNDHIMFTTKGASSLKPNISYFADQELSVSLNPTPSDESSRLEVEVRKSKARIWEGIIKVEAEVTNKGNRVIEVTELEIDEIKRSTVSRHIAPGQTVVLSISFPNNEYEELELLVKTASGNSSTDKFEIANDSVWWWTPLLYIILATISLIVSFVTVGSVKKVKARIWK